AGAQERFKSTDLFEAVHLGISVHEVFNADSSATQAAGVRVDLEEVADGVDQIVNSRGEVELLIFLVMGFPDFELPPVCLILLEGGCVQEAVGSCIELDDLFPLKASAGNLPINFVQILQHRQLRRDFAWSEVPADLLG